MLKLKTKLSGYSLLELVIVTTFIIIFLVVINPGTYINRFSKILLKINVLSESSLLINKLNTISVSKCSPILLSESSFQYLVDNTNFSIAFNNDALSITNLNSNSQAILFQYLDWTKSNNFVYLDVFFQDTISPDSLMLIDISLYSSLLLNRNVSGSILCDSQEIVLGAF